MGYVSAEQMNTAGVDFKKEFCFKVSGRWDDLHKLALQIKCQGVAPTYTVILISGKRWDEDLAELVVAGDIRLVDDHARMLVEQRIKEGLQAEIVYGNYYRDTFVYTFSEEAKQEIDDNLEIEDHPF